MKRCNRALLNLCVCSFHVYQLRSTRVNAWPTPAPPTPLLPVGFSTQRMNRLGSHQGQYGNIIIIIYNIMNIYISFIYILIIFEISIGSPYMVYIYTNIYTHTMEPRLSNATLPRTIRFTSRTFLTQNCQQYRAGSKGSLSDHSVASVSR